MQVIIGYGKVELLFNSFLTSVLDWVRGQHHARNALQPRTAPRLGRAGLDALEKTKISNSYTCRESKRSVRNILAPHNGQHACNLCYANYSALKLQQTFTSYASICKFGVSSPAFGRRGEVGDISTRVTQHSQRKMNTGRTRRT